MTLLDIRKELENKIKILKKYGSNLNKTALKIKKVNEFNKLNDEIGEIEVAIDLLRIVIWVLGDKREG